LAEPLRDALKPVASNIRAAFAYGSVAKATDQAASDIDLMVVSDSLTYGDVFGAVDRVSRTLGRHVNPTVYSAAEFSKRAKDDNAFITRVLEGPKIWVIGSEHDLPVLTGSTTRRPIAAMPSLSGVVKRELQRAGRCDEPASAQPCRLPENQTEPVVVADAELTAAVEGLVQVLVELHARFFAGARHSCLRRSKLPLFEQSIELLDAVGEEPEADVARARIASRSQREFAVAERQPGKQQLPGVLVPILHGEAD
jgi:predicted nucleotidyltransferase